jgi:HEAT repeat protein
MFNLFKPNIEKLKKKNDLIGLINSIKCRSSDIQAAAVKALNEMGGTAIDKLIIMLNDNNKNTRETAVKALEKIGAPAVKPVIAALEQGSDFYAKIALITLIQIGKPATSALIETILNKNFVVRETAYKALYEIDRNWTDSKEAEKAVPYLITVLKDDDPALRVNAAEALIQIGQTVVAPLVTILIDENESENSRMNAITILEEIKDPDAVGGLIIALKSDNENIRQAAGRTLVKFGAPVVEALIGVLKNETNSKRSTAAEALGKIKDSRAVKSLIDVLKDNDPECKRSTCQALREITNEFFGEDHAMWEEWWGKYNAAD